MSAPAVTRSKDNLLKFSEVRQRVKLSRATIYRKMAAGTFPKSEPISTGLVAWYESEIDRWVASPSTWTELPKIGAGV